MYNGKDITFLGPHHITETFVTKSKIPKVIVND